MHSLADFRGNPGSSVPADAVAYRLVTPRLRSGCGQHERVSSPLILVTICQVIGAVRLGDPRGSTRSDGFVLQHPRLIYLCVSTQSAELARHVVPMNATSIERGVPTGQPLVVPVKTAAEMVGMGKTKFWELIWAGQIPHIRIGRWVGVPVAALEKWVQQNTA